MIEINLEVGEILFESGAGPMRDIEVVNGVRVRCGGRRQRSDVRSLYGCSRHDRNKCAIGTQLLSVFRARKYVFFRMCDNVAW